MLLTELVNLRRQRQRAIWLHGNWNWIVDELAEHGIEGDLDFCPSQSTISRFLSKSDVFAIKQLYLDGLRQKQCASAFVEAHEANKQKVEFRIQYCVDGKRREGCVSSKTGRTEIDVTIMRADTREVLASCVCPDKEGESTSGRKMLRQCGKKLLPGIFTFDAGLTSPRFISSVTCAGHWYIGALKGNAGNAFDVAKDGKWGDSKLIAETQDVGHGRKEVRTIRVLMISAFPSRTFSKYSKSACIIKVTRVCEEKGKQTIEDRYFVGSRGLSSLKPEEILSHIRNHWLQENGLHWCKDAVLGEDDLFVHSNKSSRLLGFLKSIVVSVAFQMMGSVAKFVDTFAANPKAMTQQLLRSG